MGKHGVCSTSCELDVCLLLAHYTILARVRVAVVVCVCVWAYKCDWYDTQENKALACRTLDTQYMHTITQHKSQNMVLRCLYTRIASLTRAQPKISLTNNKLKNIHFTSTLVWRVRRPYRTRHFYEWIWWNAWSVWALSKSKKKKAFIMVVL